MIAMQIKTSEYPGLMDKNTFLSDVKEDAEINDDIMMMLSSETKCDRFLTPAPLAISLLGELMILSNDKDFSLAEHTPEGGFKYLRHPTSFRACLVQVSNEGWSAFNQAHTNMDQIRSYSAGVENHVNSAVKLLLEGRKEEVILVLPKCLNKVCFIADSCKSLAVNIEEKFARVMEVTAELLEVSTSAKGSYEQKYMETVNALNLAKIQKEEIQLSRQEMESKYKTLERDMKEAHDEFKSAVKNIPSTGIAFAMSMTEQTVQGVTDICKTFVGSLSPWTLIKAADSNPTSTIPDTNSRRSFTSKSERKVKAYGEGLEILKLIDNLTDIATSGRENGKPYPNKEKLQTNEVTNIRLELERKQSNWMSAETSPEETILTICKKGISICQKLESPGDLFENDVKGLKGKDIEQKAKKLQETARKFENKANRKKKESNAVDHQSPSIRKSDFQREAKNASATIIDNARYKAGALKEIYQHHLERQDKANDDLQKENERLQAMIKEMARLDPIKVDFQSIQSTLVKGIKALADIRNQWTELVKFFEKISTLIKCSLHMSLQTFVEYANSREKLSVEGLPISDVLRSLIIKEANTANGVALALASIAKTYVEVSDMYLMDRIGGLAKLIAIDAREPNASSTIASLRQDLHSGTERAQEEIKSLVAKHRLQYHRLVEARKRQLDESV